MKKVAIIDVTNVGSTGKIATNLLVGFKNRGIESKFFYGRGARSNNPDIILFEHKWEVFLHAFLARLTGMQGSFSCWATYRLIRKLKIDDFDTIILISAHAYFLNESLLYKYIARNNLTFINIMPDEYAFLGKCCNEATCNMYLSGHGKCPNIHCYPTSWFFDACPLIIKKKKDNYSRLKKAVFVGPEYVIRRLNNSYLGKYMETEILDETIDINMYKPKDCTELRKRLGINRETIVVLCVAPPYKGASFFIKLAECFRHNDKYFFVYIGKLDCESRDNFLHINFIESDNDLSYYYSLADLFVFTSVRDTMPATCLEALACGTPLMVYNISGMPYILDNSVGYIVEPYDLGAMVEIVSNMQKKEQKLIDHCRDYAVLRYDSCKYVDRIIQIVESVESKVN